MVDVALLGGGLLGLEPLGLLPRPDKAGHVAGYGRCGLALDVRSSVYQPLIQRRRVGLNARDLFGVLEITTPRRF